jgi:hypothetical protein
VKEQRLAALGIATALLSDECSARHVREAPAARAAVR